MNIHTVLLGQLAYVLNEFFNSSDFENDDISAIAMHSIAYTMGAMGSPSGKHRAHEEK